MRKPSFWTLEEIKDFANISPQDTSLDEVLQESAVAMSLLYESRLKRKFAPFECVSLPDPPCKRYTFRDVVNMTRWMINGLLRYEIDSLFEKNAAEEEQGLRRLIERSLETWAEHPDKTVVWIRSLREARVKNLTCGVLVNWYFSKDQLQIKVEKGKLPRLSKPQKTSLEREILLSYTNAKTNEAPVRMVVEWGGERERSTELTQFVKTYRDQARKRLYLPLPAQLLATNEAFEQAIEDLTAQVCINLVQGKVVGLDQDLAVAHFLLSYLRKFRWARQVGEGELLTYLLQHYGIPEDSRAWRMYVSTAINTLRRNERQHRASFISSKSVEDMADAGHMADAEDMTDAMRNLHLKARSITMSPSESENPKLVPDVAEGVGLKPWSVYNLIKKGKLKAELVASGRKQYFAVSDTEIKRMEQKQTTKRLRRAIVTARAQKQGCTIASARRWVERQEAKGLGMKEMTQAIGQKRVQEAIRLRVHGAEEEKKRRSRGVD